MFWVLAQTHSPTRVIETGLHVLRSWLAGCQGDQTPDCKSGTELESSSDEKPRNNLDRVTTPKMSKNKARCHESYCRGGNAHDDSGA